MSNNINRTEGGGPWILEPTGPLDPGEEEVMDLERMAHNGRKRYFQPWLPMDQVLVKNLDSSNPVHLTYNGLFEAFVEPNAADTFDDAGVNRIRIKNEGGATIAADDLKIQVMVLPYNADDQAREEKKRHPVESMIRGTLNL